MMQRRAALKIIATGTIAAISSPAGASAPSKVRVTLVRWPYT